MESYYSKELNRIDIKKGNMTIQFYGHIVGTQINIRSLNINLESIKDIKKFLSKVEKELKKGAKND